MADDRTPRTISLTECPPDEDLPRTRKRDKDAADRRHIRLDHEAVVATERKAAEEGAQERPGSKLS